MMNNHWSRDDGRIDVTSAFQGISAPIGEIFDDIHRRGWTAKVHVKNDTYVAEAKNPHGEKLEAKGRTDATAAANLLVKIMRREFMRSHAARIKLGAWDHFPIEQQFSAVAQAYATAPVYDPKAASAWMELAKDFSMRAQIIRGQLSVEYVDQPVPYETADELREDVTRKRHVTISRAYPHHPIWSEAQMLDYRLVVDVLGHCSSGGDWGWHGTVLAFSSLAPLLGDEPQKALFTELLGQTAFGVFYRQWGPQKVAFLDKLVEKAQEDENKPGHHPVHPSQSIVPSQLPSIFTKVGALTRTQLLQQRDELAHQWPDRAEVLHQWPDGWSIRRPTTYGDIHRQGELLGNCLSLNNPACIAFTDHPYWPKDAEGEPTDSAEMLTPEQHQQILTHLDQPLPEDQAPWRERSLHDPDGLPRAVFTQARGIVDDVLGRHNSDPKPEYLARLSDYAQQHGMDPVGDENVREDVEGYHDPTDWEDQRTSATAATDPNANWESGVQPLQDNAYMWQRANGRDPLDISTAQEELRKLEPGVANMHPQMGKQAVINALRNSVLGSRTSPYGHARHYQDLMHIPAEVDDPIAYWDTLEQRREAHNQGQGYAPGSHKQYWPEELQFKQWVKAANPGMDDGEVNQVAKRELLHMLMEEEERILVQDEGEQLPAEHVEHEVYEALRKRLKTLTKPNVDQKVDFGDQQMFHQAAGSIHTPGAWPEGGLDWQQRWDALGDDEPVWLFHATEPEYAERFLTEGASPETKPRSLGRERYEKGEYAEYQPGAGLGAGLSVGMAPWSVSGYGHNLFAVQVPKGHVGVSPEQAALGETSPGGALRVNDAMVTQPVPPSAFRAIDTGGRVPDRSLFDRLARTSASASQAMYHVAPRDVRTSIERSGLNPGSYLVNTRWGVPAMQEADERPTDVWEAQVDPDQLEADPEQPEAWSIHRAQIPSTRLRRVATYHADMYPPYLYSRLRPLAGISRHANELSRAAQEDLLKHKGSGHHFRSKALSLGIPQLGPRQVSNAWLHVAPQTSQLGVIDPHISEVLGHDYATETNPRDYFKHERELAAGRDASGYGHVPLGSFSAALWDQKAGGPGWHPDRTPFKASAPTPHASVDWNAQTPAYPDWGNQYWWDSTQQARDQVGQDFDRTVGVNFPQSKIPYQPSGRTPYLTDPMTGERRTGRPGASLMQHLKDTLGLSSAQDVWNQELEAGKVAKLAETQHRLWFNPKGGAGGDWGRGLYHVPSKTLWTWPEEEMTHLQAIDSFPNNADPDRLQCLRISPHGRVNVDWLVHPEDAQRIEAIDPRLSVIPNKVCSDCGNQNPASTQECIQCGQTFNPQLRTGMAERSGFPELDQAIEEFMRLHPEIEEMRDPQNAWGNCEIIAEECAAFLKERGFKAYAASDDLRVFEGYGDAQDSKAIGAGDFSYPEHAVVEVYGMYGPNNINNVYIDFTASQYGFTEFPKIHGGRIGSTST